MKTSPGTLLLVCCGAGLLAMLTGCATMTSKQVSANDPSDYNIALEKAQNEMLLLNIVRAYKRRPMYFTSIADFQGSTTYSLETGDLNIPFGHAASTAWSLAPKAFFSTNPVLHIAVWDKKEFLKGMYDPTPLETLQHYWREGWKPEMLLNLLVQRITRFENNEKWETYTGSLGNPCTETLNKYSSFQEVLRDYTDCDLVTRKTENKKTPVGELIPACKINDASLPAVVDGYKKMGLTIERTDAGYQLYKVEEGETYYCFDCGEESGGETRIVACDVCGSLDDWIKSAIYVNLRSPEGVLYYLGEMMRAEAKDGFVPEIVVKGENECRSIPLFVARETKPGESPIVSVRYDGTCYVIPRDTFADEEYYANSSMQVLSFVSLLISKQKTAGEAPTTTGTATLLK